MAADPIEVISLTEEEVYKTFVQLATENLYRNNGISSPALQSAGFFETPFLDWVQKNIPLDTLNKNLTILLQQEVVEIIFPEENVHSINIDLFDQAGQILTELLYFKNSFILAKVSQEDLRNTRDAKKREAKEILAGLNLNSNIMSLYRDKHVCISANTEENKEETPLAIKVTVEHEFASALEIFQEMTYDQKGAGSKAFNAGSTLECIKQYEALISKLQQDFSLNASIAKQIAALVGAYAAQIHRPISNEQYQALLANRSLEARNEIYYHIARRNIAVLMSGKLGAYLQEIVRIIERAFYNVGWFNSIEITYNDGQETKNIPDILYKYYVALQSLIEDFRDTDEYKQDVVMGTLLSFRRIIADRIPLSLNNTIHYQWHIMNLDSFLAQSATTKDPVNSVPSVTPLFSRFSFRPTPRENPSDIELSQISYRSSSSTPHYFFHASVQENDPESGPPTQENEFSQSVFFK